MRRVFLTRPGYRLYVAKTYYIGHYDPPWRKMPGYMLFTMCAGTLQNNKVFLASSSMVHGKFISNF